MQISVFCPMKFHAFHLAEQLYKHESLERLYTSYYGRFGNKRNNHGISLPKSKVQTDLVSAFLAYGYNPGSDLWLWQRFGEWAKKYVHNQDIVISWGLAALPIIQRAKEHGIISIVERGSAHAAVQRDILIEEYETFGHSTDELRRSFSPERMERELLEYELADYIEVPSEFAKKSFIEQGIPQEKIIKGFRGVDLSSFRQVAKEDDVFRVIYAGQLSLQKGVQYLLQAFAELNLPDAECWLFGSVHSEIEPFLEQFKGHYRHFAPVPQRELYRHYSQGTVFVICSLQEGLAQVQPQAMACGLPIICTTNTGGEDLITNGVEGFVVPIRDVQSLKEKILYMYENPDVCYEMGRSAKQRVQTGLTWDDYGDFIVETYRDIVKRKQ